MDFLKNGKNIFFYKNTKNERIPLWIRNNNNNQWRKIHKRKHCQLPNKIRNKNFKYIPNQSPTAKRSKTGIYKLPVYFINWIKPNQTEKDSSSIPHIEPIFLYSFATRQQRLSPLLRHATEQSIAHKIAARNQLERCAPVSVLIVGRNLFR